MKQETPTPFSHSLRPGADFLQFAVAFAQRDLTRLRPGDWTNLREDFEMSLGHTSWIGASGNCIRAHPAAAPASPLPGHFALQHFQTLQQQLLPLLQDEAHATMPAETSYPVAHVWYVHGLDGLTPGRRELVVSGDPAECFGRILTWLLEQEPPGRILACPECGTLFYRYKQQAYCTRKCGNRLTVRNFRARVAATSSTSTPTIELQTRAQGEANVDPTCTRGVGGGRVGGVSINWLRVL